VDIIKPINKAPLRKNRLIIAALVVLIGYLLIDRFNTELHQVTLAKKELIIATVKRGNIAITIDGYGYLASEKRQIITSYSRATVKEIVLKPGAKVQKDSVIVILANPELDKQRENAQYALVEAQANLRQLTLNQQRQLLTEKAQQAELLSEHKAIKLRLAAQQQLIANGIVSQLDYQSVRLHESQLKERITILEQATKQLILINKEAINIQLERIKQRQSQVESAQNRLDKLKVKANFDGVLQKLSVSLGQSLSAGEEIAMIGSTTELIANVRISQTQAEKLLIGQIVKIDTRLDIIVGEIKRIDPIVVDNTVKVEIKLPKVLPKNARPQQNIDASIMVKTLQNILYIERPANIKANTTNNLYRLDESQTLAYKTQLMVGNKTNGFIELVNGAQQGQRFIISDLSNYQQDEIAIN
jgi:multidrug efflux pump subunit AcrA (membrane-fusion protein)